MFPGHFAADSNSASVEWGPGTCISTRAPGDSPSPMFGTQWVEESYPILIRPDKTLSDIVATGEGGGQIPLPSASPPGAPPSQPGLLLLIRLAFLTPPLGQGG